MAGRELRWLSFVSQDRTCTCLAHPMKKRFRGILYQAEDCTRAVRFEWIALRSYANWSG